LRSGFICSAIIAAGSSKDEQKAILEDCAMVAGWRPFQWAQMRYVKESQTRTVVSSRLLKRRGKLYKLQLILIIVYVDQQPLPLIEEELCCPLRYHKLEKLENLWPKKFNGSAIRNQFLLRYAHTFIDMT
jgi:hypothetical protein